MYTVPSFGLLPNIPQVQRNLQSSCIKLLKHVVHRACAGDWETRGRSHHNQLPCKGKWSQKWTNYHFSNSLMFEKTIRGLKTQESFILAFCLVSHTGLDETIHGWKCLHWGIIALCFPPRSVILISVGAESKCPFEMKVLKKRESFSCFK